MLRAITIVVTEYWRSLIRDASSSAFTDWMLFFREFVMYNFFSGLKVLQPQAEIFER